MFASSLICIKNPYYIAGTVFVRVDTKGDFVVEDDDIETIDIEGSEEGEEKEEEEELIEVCPVCGSPDLYYETGGIEGLYHCKYCAYIGGFVIDANKKMITLIREEYERKLRISE